MLRHTREIALMLLVACSAGAQTAKVQNVVTMDEFVQDWKISKQFTMDVANAMPADQYNFKPTPEEMTFAELMLHIAEWNVIRFKQITQVKPPFEPKRSSELPKDKASVMQVLEQSFDYVIAVLPQITDEELKPFTQIGKAGRIRTDAP
jgi:hypothetical protein